jgi:S-adenosyl-methyltransferase MraW
MAEFSHAPVMLNECIDALNIKSDGTYMDGTAGGGGHSEEIIKRLGISGRLIAVDQDINAVNAVTKRLDAYKDKLILVNDNFVNADDILTHLDVNIDGALLDLGVSSYQLDTPERGFSYSHDAPLDMRMKIDADISAYDIVNGYTDSRLMEILYKWGEEKFASRIASFIVRARENKPIETTFELVDIVKNAIPAKARETGHHPCKRTFQAIRIEVNRELDCIAPAVSGILNHMNTGGRIAIITFHSLEDRIVKHTFNEYASGCICPRDFPVCVCGNTPKIKIISKKPIVPNGIELENNPRSRSAKLRIAEKL